MVVHEYCSVITNNKLLIHATARGVSRTLDYVQEARHRTVLYVFIYVTNKNRQKEFMVKEIKTVIAFAG